MSAVARLLHNHTDKKQKIFSLKNYIPIILVLVTPVLLMTCDSNSMWDYLNKNLITSRISISTTALTINESATDTGGFSVNMLEKPNALVVVSLTLTDTSQADIPISSFVKDSNANYAGIHLEFTPDDWMDTRTIFIIGVPNTNPEGTVISQLNMQTMSADDRYNGFTLTPITITSTDDEVAGNYDWARSVITGSYNSIKNSADGSLLSGYADDNIFDLPFANGFSFYFLGTSYANVYVCANGFLIFNSTTPTGNLKENAVLFDQAKDPEFVIAPWWDDLQANPAILPHPQIYYQLTGTAPDRVLIIEWYCFSYQGDASKWFNFQVRLYETSNNIEFYYGDTSLTAPITPTPTPSPTPTLSPSPTPTPTPTPTGTIGTEGASTGIKGQDDEGSNFIDGSNGAILWANRKIDLMIADFPAKDTVITFTPR